MILKEYSWLSVKGNNNNLVVFGSVDSFLGKKSITLGYEFFNQEEKKHFQLFDFYDLFFSVNQIFIKKYNYKSREIMLFSHKEYNY